MLWAVSNAPRRAAPALFFGVAVAHWSPVNSYELVVTPPQQTRKQDGGVEGWVEPTAGQ